MKKLKNKYEPMIIVLYFAIMGFFIAVILATLRHFLDNTPFIKMLEVPAFMSIVGIFIGLIYCEVRFWINSLWISSLLFGILSINLFMFLRPISKLLFKGHIGNLFTVDEYLIATLFGSPLLALLYFSIEKKKPNKS